MSGYLYRLVQTVSQPPQTVHPRTGSLFAPYRSAPDSAAEWFEHSETVATQPTRSESFKTSEPADAVRRTARLDPPESPLLPAAASEPPRLFEWEQRTDTTRATSKEAPHETFEHSEHAPLPVAAPQEVRAFPDSERQAGVERYELLIHPQARETKSTEPKTPLFATEGGGKREAKTNLRADGRSARTERQADEIQIHIGRIEVTAVPPPAPRAPKAPDKGLSLDAYLGRRNGRLR